MDLRAGLRLVALSLACGLLLGACATPSSSPPMLRQAAAQSVTPVAVDEDLPLKLIGAELALQHNDLAAAASGYTEASLLSIDPAIAEQAVRLALGARQLPLARTAVARWQALDPDATGIVQTHAWIAVAEGDEESAFDRLATLARRTTASGWRPLGQVLVNAEDKALAARLLARLATAERLGDSELIWVGMSQLALKLGDKDLAERLAGGAVERFGGSEAHAWHAQLALDRGDKAAALARYAEALRRDPASLRLRTGYAALLSGNGDNAGAARALAGGLQTDVTFGARAAYAARAEDNRLLVELYREIEADTSERSGRRLFLLGQIAEIIEQPGEALDWYREVPDDDENWFDAGVRMVVLTDQAGDGDSAMTRLLRLREFASGDPHEAGNLVLLEADLLSRKSRKSDALAVYGRGLEQFPDDPRLLYSRAMLAIDLDDLAGAERDLRRMIELDPDNADALNALGYTLADRTDRFVEANELIGKALRLKPDEPAIIDSYGWVQFRLGNLDEAIRQLEIAYALHPDSEIAAHLGEVLWTRGERDAALRIWSQALEKDPESTVLRETVQRLTP